MIMRGERSQAIAWAVALRISRRYALELYRQTTPRAQRLARTHDIPVPPRIYATHRLLSTYPISPRKVPGERAMIARIVAGDE
jgi:hypothetical protein